MSSIFHWHERTQNLNDRRSVLVSLTETGFSIIDSAVTSHVATQYWLTSSLSADEYKNINTLLKKHLKNIEDK